MATPPSQEAVFEFLARLASRINFFGNFTSSDVQELMKKRINHLGSLVEKLLHCELHVARAVPDTDIIVRCLPREVVEFIESSPRNRELLELLAGGRHEVKEIAKLQIDRSKPFDYAFVGPESEIEEEDQRSLALSEIDLADIRFEAMLEDSETSVDGGSRLGRLRGAGYIRLDAKIFQTLWENQQLIPERWKERTKGQMTKIFFEGTVLRSSHSNRGDNRYVLCLYWDGSEWCWCLSWVVNDRHVNEPSAVIKQLVA